MKDKDIVQELFTSYKPDMGDSMEYLKKIDNNLEVFESIKKTRDREISFTRIKIAIAFICGCLAGIIVIAYNIPLKINWAYIENILHSLDWEIVSAVILACSLLGVLIYSFVVDDSNQ